MRKSLESRDFMMQKASSVAGHSAVVNEHADRGMLLENLMTWNIKRENPAQGFVAEPSV